MALLAVDIDDVLSDTTRSFVDFFNSRSDLTIDKGDFYTTDWTSVLKISQSEMRDLMSEFAQSDYFLNLPTVEGSVEALQKLSLKFDIHIVTSRWGAVVENTDSWLRKHFGDSFADVHFSTAAHLNYTGAEKRRKSDICKQLGASIIVEDCTVHARDCLTAGMDVFLLSQPWNASLDTSGISKVGSWKQVIELLS